MTTRLETAQRAGYGVANGLHALEILAATPMTVPKLADALGVCHDTARKIVYRLVYEGYLIKTHDGYRAPYAIGSRGKALGQSLDAAPEPTSWLDPGFRPWPGEPRADRPASG